MDSVLRTELERAIEEVTGSSMKVESKLERMELRSPIEREEVAVIAPDFADDVAEMFGGEVVD